MIVTPFLFRSRTTRKSVSTGAITPTAGTIVVNGKEFSEMTPKLAKEQGIGVIYQEFTLVPGISAAENVFLADFLRSEHEPPLPPHQRRDDQWRALPDNLS